MVVEHAIRHVSIHGRVQGVGYRAFVEREALRAGVEGWARNRSDGSVEVVFSGEAGVVRKLIDVCRRGPYSARVETLQEREAAADEFALRRRGDVFSVLPTL
jgi:acylphosphatase